MSIKELEVVVTEVWERVANESTGLTETRKKFEVYQSGQLKGTFPKRDDAEDFAKGLRLQQSGGSQFITNPRKEGSD